MLNFFNDIDDVANSLEVFSYGDAVQTQLSFSYGVIFNVLTGVEPAVYPRNG